MPPPHTQGDPRAFAEYQAEYRNTICGRHPIGVLLNVRLSTTHMHTHTAGTPAHAFFWASSPAPRPRVACLRRGPAAAV